MQPADSGKPEKAISPARRWSGLYTLVLLILLLIFFALHQKQQTGFFTSKFGPAEMVALYLPILVAMIAPIVRLIQGRNRTAVLVDAVSDTCLAIGSLWLWLTFPFDFSHLAGVFPARFEIALAWLNDGIGRIILLLQIIIGFISALSSIVTYLRER